MSRLAACLASAALAIPPAAVGVSAELADFWDAYRTGSPELSKQAARLDYVVRTELGPDGDSVREAVRLLSADPARAWSARLALIDADVPDAQRAFVQAAVRDYDAAYEASPGSATTTLGHHGDHSLARMTDGDPGTYYWSAGAAVRNATVTLDLGRPRRVHGVRLALGKPDRPRDHLHEGVLEFSADGEHWYAVARLDGPKHDIEARAEIRYLRLRSTADQRHWLVIRELSIVACPTGRAADGDPSTVFTVTAEAVEIPLNPDRGVTAIVVRAAPDTPRGGKVEVRAAGSGWHTLGRLTGPYTELPVSVANPTRVRIVLDDDLTPLGVHEVTARPAG